MKYKPVKFESAIARMGYSAMFVKTWATALVLFASQSEKAVYLLFFFWVFDTYYLVAERAFRLLGEDDSLDFHKTRTGQLRRSVLSPFNLMFYLALLSYLISQ